MRPLSRLLGAAVVAATLAAAAPASAQDSLAPPGSKRTWLPKEAWVLNHWLPYDEGRLFRYLGMSRQDIRVYFQGPKLQRVPPLAVVARRRGYTVSGLARRLVASWHPRVTHKKRALLLDTVHHRQGLHRLRLQDQHCRGAAGRLAAALDGLLHPSLVADLSDDRHDPLLRPDGHLGPARRLLRLRRRDLQGRPGEGSRTPSPRCCRVKRPPTTHGRCSCGPVQPPRPVPRAS